MLEMLGSLSLCQLLKILISHQPHNQSLTHCLVLNGLNGLNGINGLNGYL